MRALHELLSALTKDEQQNLRLTCIDHPTIPSILIASVLDDPSLSANEFILQNKVTNATYNKSLSLALSHVFEFLSANLSNPYDGTFLVRELVIRGLLKYAKHEYLKLEKELEQKSLYPQLNASYHEGTRICYHAGDKVWFATLRKKIEKNSSHLETYNKLDKAIMANVLDLVRKPSKSTVQGHELEQLRKKTIAFGHPVLIHNALTTQLAYSRQTRKTDCHIYKTILKRGPPSLCTIIRRFAQRSIVFIRLPTAAILRSTTSMHEFLRHSLP
ncbi:MAG TPA: hypothetical protein VEW28_09095 [Candidatus Kapabacteria bacterium]|nr:hypothetical protein [Candidatus Kapabacteria bacterium]